MNMFLAAVDSLPKVNFGDALMNAFIVMLVVFVALLVLSLIIGLFGSFGSNKQKPAAKPAPVANVTPAVSAPATATAAVGEDEDEIAAVIAAAVAMMAPAGVTYRVRRITPAGVRNRSEWATAAIRQNTLPF